MSALSDTLEASKLQALEGSGFRWLDRQAVWVHPGQRKVISNEWAHDKSLADLQAETRETGAPGAWSFTSIAPMSDAARDAIIRSIEAKLRIKRSHDRGRP